MSKRHLILCDENDGPAWWAAHGLKSRGLGDVEVWTPLQLRSFTWQHRVDNNAVRTRIVTEPGVVIDDSDIGGVLNRLLATPLPPAERVSSEDRRYIEEEAFAFHLSWLSALHCPVVNRPTPTGLQPTHDILEVRLIAAQEGLPPVPLSASSRHPPGFMVPQPPSKHAIWVCGERWFGEGVEPSLGDAAVRVARRLGLTLAMFRLSETHHLLDVDSCPDLSIGGDPLLDELALTLTTQS